MTPLLVVASLALIAYYAVHQLLLVALVTRAAAEILRERAWPDTLAHELSYSSPFAPPVSVVVPAHNEEAGIVESIRSLMEVRYPKVQVVVVDDGSTDRTAELLRAEFGLVSGDVPVVAAFPQTGSTLETLRSSEHPGLTMIRKASTGRRADAVNAALRVCTGDLVCMIDADSILEPDALLHVVQPFIDDPSVVAAGGVVLPSNGANVIRGRLTTPRVPGSLVARTQVLEYLRAFLVGRAGWSSMNGLLVISGAFGIFRRQTLVEIGGLRTTSLAEDAELVVDAHRLMRDQGAEYRIVFIPEPVCWTEVPSTLRVLARQRRRWSEGLAELVRTNWRMVGRPRYGPLGFVTLPYFIAFELLGPVAEVVGFALLVLGVVLGAVGWGIAGVYLSVSVVLTVLTSLCALLVEEMSFARYPRTRDVVNLIVAACLEPLWYHPLTVWWRLGGLIRAATGRRSSWGEMTRAGFGTA